jgi:transposase
MDANIIQILQEVNKDGQKSKILKLVKRFAMVLLNKLDFPMETIGRILNVSRNTVLLWCNRFEIDPYGGLTDLPRSGRPKILSTEEEKEVEELLDTSLEKITVESSLAGNDLKNFIKVQFNKICSLSYIYKIVEKLGFSYKMPQPIHPKNDKIIMLNWINKFKKNMRILKSNLKNKSIDFYFQDETRFGQKTIATRIWSRKGVKIKYINQNGFLNSWIYGAVNPINGKSHSLILPTLNAVNMQIFIDSFSKKIPKNKHIVMILDGSRAHKNGILHTNKNLTLYFLPPYSPELNPIEILWLFIKKKYLSFKLYNNIEEIDEKGSWAWNKITPEMIKSICKCDYLPIFC